MAVREFLALEAIICRREGKAIEKKLDFLNLDIRDVAQPGSALRSGRRGRWFESSHPDLIKIKFKHHD